MYHHVLMIPMCNGTWLETPRGPMDVGDGQHLRDLKQNQSTQSKYRFNTVKIEVKLKSETSPKSLKKKRRAEVSPPVSGKIRGDSQDPLPP